MATDPLLEVSGLSISFGIYQAVRDLSFTVGRREIVGLVGESGSGKSITALSILRLMPPAARIVAGDIRLNGKDILGLRGRALQALRGKSISMIFQEPSTSLNPVMSVGWQVTESVRLHEDCTERHARARTIELFDLVGLKEPQRLYDEFPHRLSGGMQQRVMIAMAVACGPEFLIADEPTTALDVTVQEQVLRLLDELRDKLSMSILLITHDIGVVADWTDRVVVMYGGQKCEEAATGMLLTSPTHPYTRRLLGASLPLGSNLHFRTARLPEMDSSPIPTETN